MTAVFSEQIAGVFGSELVIPPGAAAVADNILFLLVFTDHGFEVAYTFETAEAILTGVASVPAILMSAARRQIAVPAGEEFPEFSTLLRKPFQLKPLMEAVVALIGPGG